MFHIQHFTERKQSLAVAYKLVQKTGIAREQTSKKGFKMAATFKVKLMTLISSYFTYQHRFKVGDRITMLAWIKGNTIVSDI